MGGADWHTVSVEFKEQIAVLAFVPVNESTIEGKHSVANRYSRHATNIGPTTISLSNRWPLVNELLEAHESNAMHVVKKELMESLLAAFTLARKPKCAAQALGLLQHPLVKMALENDARLKSSRRLADAFEHLIMAIQLAVYRVDLEHMFQDLRPTSAQNQREMMKMLRKQHLATAILSTRAALDYNIILKHARLQHFREVADEASVYSIRLDAAMSGAVETLKDYFAEPSPVACEDVAAHTVFFQLLKAQPGRQKQARIAPGARRSIHDKHLAIHLWKAVVNDGRRICLQAAQLGEAHGNRAVALLEGLQLNDTMQGFVVQRYVLVSAPDDLSNGVSELLLKLAQGPVSKLELAENLQDLVEPMNVLAARNMVQECEDSLKWSLRAEHLARLYYCLELEVDGGRQCLEVRPGITVNKMTLWELLHTLAAADFTWRCLPKKKADKMKLQNYKPGDAKVWYSSGVCPCLDYLRCLLQAEDLFAGRV